MPFLVKTEIKSSNIPNAGRGRFFLEDLDKDTIIRKQTIDSDELFVFKKGCNLELVNLDYLKSFGHTQPNDDNYDDSIYLNNPPLYTNHSKEPNIYFIFKENEKFTLTSKNVKKGDEMYQDYSIYKKVEWFESYLKQQNKVPLRDFGNQINLQI